MVRVVIFSLVGFLVGVVFGFAFFLTRGAIAGGAFGIMIGSSVATYMNQKRVLDRPFYTQDDVDRFMRIVPYKTAGLPGDMQSWLNSKIRSMLESWL
jgi:hypothetical protein